MKKCISSFLLGAVLFGSMGVLAATAYNAQKAAFKVFVNGEEFQATTGEILDVNDRTYLPLRDMGNALGITVNWNEDLQQVEVGTPPQAPQSPSTNYSRNNPAPLNVAQTVTVDNYIEKYTASVRVISVIRGAEAWKQIKETNMFNDEAPDGYEYILAKVAVSAISVSDDKALDVNRYNFDTFSGNNESYANASVVVPDVLSSNIYTGGNCEGNIVALVKTDDANPKVAYGLDYSGSGGIWFSLSE
ncbi:MAG: copper amine oxidase [Clostridiales bacterium]|jgi:hypothetical protein|nr:copper amine oxidase [Clostridiales bacterium]